MKEAHLEPAQQKRQPMDDAQQKENHSSQEQPGSGHDKSSIKSPGPEQRAQAEREAAEANMIAQKREQRRTRREQQKAAAKKANNNQYAVSSQDGKDRKAKEQGVAKQQAGTENKEGGVVNPTLIPQKRHDELQGANSQHQTAGKIVNHDAHTGQDLAGRQAKGGEQEKTVVHDELAVQGKPLEKEQNEKQIEHRPEHDEPKESIPAHKEDSAQTADQQQAKIQTPHSGVSHHNLTTPNTVDTRSPKTQSQAGTMAARISRPDAIAELEAHERPKTTGHEVEIETMNSNGTVHGNARLTEPFHPPSIVTPGLRENAHTSHARLTEPFH
ncbi:hypothetical protein BDW02DRAFT_600287 [Decorospora gaudefroyi]|uniref:Uncharacterized protein n=1 Tax=Decorospora gaudefroyi TaxID=184978 RepID=A0A6A5K2Z3_9PLEO|nr:hypothetical protein BDW02DRAFT_600287 [Decorospora gaudefroyi]